MLQGCTHHLVTNYFCTDTHLPSTSRNTTASPWCHLCTSASQPSSSSFLSPSPHPAPFDPCTLFFSNFTLPRAPLHIPLSPTHFPPPSLILNLSDVQIHPLPSENDTYQCYVCYEAHLVHQNSKSLHIHSTTAMHCYFWLQIDLYKNYISISGMHQHISDIAVATHETTEAHRLHINANILSFQLLARASGTSGVHCDWWYIMFHSSACSIVQFKSLNMGLGNGIMLCI